MSNAGRRAVPAWFLVSGLVVMGSAAASHDGSESIVLRLRMLEVEDSRAATPDALAPLWEGLKSAEPAIQRQAVRALGRFERPELVETIVPLLAAPAPEVRSEAASALAQAVRSGAAAPARRALLERVHGESEPATKGAILAALGRLPGECETDVRDAERAIRAAIAPEEGAEIRGRPPGPRFGRVPPVVLLGAAQGFETLARAHAQKIPPEPATVTCLQDLATLGVADRAEPAVPPGTAARVRRLAMAALVAARVPGEGLTRRALSDSDDQVRRLAVQAVAGTDPLRFPLLSQALQDPSPLVRHETLRTLGRLNHANTCDLALTELGDSDTGVRLHAVDLLGATCGGSQKAVSALKDLVGGKPDIPAGNWHLRAHALVALARLRPAEAQAAIELCSTAAVWQTRMYAARAAAASKIVSVLDRLVADANPNVGEAALIGLRELRGHDADALFLAALARENYQLLITAARALAGSPRGAEAARGLIDALDRVTAERRETSRDVRRALIERVAELGEVSLTERLRPYLEDFDPTVADDAARVLSQWTGQAQVASPKPLPRQPLPSPKDLDRLARSRYVLRIDGERTATLRLLADQAPLNAHRFDRLARSGYFNGLTFHRVIPGFVVQGGSPGANEFAGDGPFTRDEVGVSNLRGTVGVSTRGRDTGDGQFYVNLVDNVRLDGEYTIYGDVVEGMEAVDALLEGSLIERIDVVSSPAEPSSAH